MKNLLRFGMIYTVGIIIGLILFPHNTVLWVLLVIRVLKLIIRGKEEFLNS